MSRMKLSTQILLYFTVCISVLFTIQMVVTTHHSQQIQSTQTDSLNEQLLSSRASEIGSWLNQRICETRLVAQNDCFNTLDMPAILNYVASTSGFASEIYGELRHPFVFADTNGTVHLPNGSSLDISSREFFQRTLHSNDEYIISKPFFSRLEWQRSITITYPVYGTNGNRVGYILGSLLANNITELLTATDIYGGRVWILDGEGTILAEDDNHEHGIHLEDCPKSFDLISTAAIVSQSPHGKQQVSFGNISDGQLLYASIPYTEDWKLCVLVSQKVVYSSLHQMTSLTLFLWAAMITASLLFSLIYIRHVTRPLDRLTASMDAFDPQSSVLLPEENGTKEVVRLTRSFNSMSVHIRTLIKQIVVEQQQKQEAERRALQAQINPHFLYNTLDTISWKAQAYGADEVSDMISALSQFFRLSLSDGHDFISLNDELEHVYSYLFIQQIRYADKLDFSLSVDDSLKDCLVPKLILQPLVENALYHGIKPQEKRGSITVDIRAEGENILMRVIDDGVGIPPERLSAIEKSMTDKEGNAFGLFNVSERIRLCYGPPYKLTLTSAPGRGTTACIRIPKEKPATHV